MPQVQVSGAIMDLEVSWDKAIVTVAAGETVHFFDTGIELGVLRLAAPRQSSWA